MIKLRKTSEQSPTSMLLEPPYSLNGSAVDLSSTPRWRHMKYVFRVIKEATIELIML